MALQTLVFLLPASRRKNRLLRRMGHDIADSAVIAPTVALGIGHLRMGDHAVIGPFNTFRNMNRVELGDHAVVGQLNWVSAAPEFQARGEGHAVLVLHDHATIVARHYLDCSGGVTIEPFGVLAGWHSVILTHQANRDTALVDTAGVRIGAHTLVNAANRLAPSATVPDRSVTGLGSVVLPGLTQPDHSYDGMPARPGEVLDRDAAFVTRRDTTLPVGPVG